MTIVTVDELAARLDDPATVVVDVRYSLTDHEWGGRAYDDGHVPGAVFADLEADLADSQPAGRPGGRHPLPDPSAFTDWLARIGIGPDSFVVADDAAGGATASRLWWMLRSIGHPGGAAVLDGGLPAWETAGHGLSRESADRAPATYPPGERWTGVVDADGVDAALAAGRTVVDSRAAERYRGDAEPLDPRAGHVPGAVNLFHAEVVAAEGTFRSPDELRARFDGIGSDAVVYCGSGVTACHNLLAMAIAGIDDAQLYAGSWSDWSSIPSRPVRTGSDPS